jgi:hypothetical protein
LIGLIGIKEWMVLIEIRLAAATVDANQSVRVWKDSAFDYWRNDAGRNRNSQLDKLQAKLSWISFAAKEGKLENCL